MRRRHGHGNRHARIRWWTLPLMLVAVGFIVLGVLWARGPAGTTPSPAPAPPPSRSGDAPASAVAGDGAMPPAPDPLLGGFSPVRVLVMDEAGGSFTIELCSATTQSVLIRWYADDDPSQLVSQQTVTVSKGKEKFPLKKDLVPTAQTVGLNGGQVGQEIGPGQSGSCP